MEYYADLITGKSFNLMIRLKRQSDFILIGGWAVFLYTHSLKSKDIDIVVDYEELSKLRRVFGLRKNQRLKKYEISLEEIDIDVYVPHYSNPGIPAEAMKRYVKKLGGFLVPEPEVLLILKQRAYLARKNSPKGEKDRLDIIGLLKNLELDFKFYRRLIKKHQLANHPKMLKELLNSVSQAPQLGINRHQYAKLKKKILKQVAE